MKLQGRFLALGLLLAGACRGGSLGSVNGSLSFSSPTDPTALQEPDGGLVEIEFGPVAVGTTKTLTLSIASLGTDTKLVSLTTLQADPEFSFQIQAGIVPQSTPLQVPVSFSPTTLGDRSATFELLAFSTANETIILALSGTGVTNGLVVTPNPIDFGQVELNQSDSTTVTITNQSMQTVSLAVSGIQDQDGGFFFLRAPASGTLAPGASTIMTATFEALELGPASASFTLNNWLTNPIPLVGVGIKDWLQISSPVDFSFVQLGTFFVKPVVVTNLSGDRTLHLTTVPYFNLVDEDSEFHFAYPLPAFPIEISPGQSFPLEVSFAPTSLGPDTEEITLATDDPDQPVPVVEVVGYGGGPKVLCQSPLPFGPVAVGFSMPELDVCTNAGVDIPGHPEVGLEIAPGAVSSDNPDFMATVLAPDGGFEPDGGIFLSSGQSVTIQVVFQPPDAGAFGGTLSVITNDLDDNDAGIPLSGEGVEPGPCESQFLPAAVDFGEVPVGATGVLQFEVDNIGHDFCILTGVSLDPASDPAFAMWDAGSRYVLLSFAGNTDNPVGLPQAVRADVQFTPTAVETPASGNAEVTIFNSSPKTQPVPLTGYSAQGCLSIEPSSYDFGRLGFSPSQRRLCVPATQGFAAMNACSTPVTVTGLDLNPGLDPLPQFFLTSKPAVPFNLDPGAQFVFRSRFEPNSTGERIEAIQITSSDLPTTPYLVSLLGNPELGGSRTDSFVVPKAQVDVVWILDEDDSYPEVQNVIALLPQLMASLTEAQVDFQMAATSTDTCVGAHSDQGAFEPCTHCLSTASPDPIFVTSATPDPTVALADLFSAFDIPPQLGYCANINGDDHFFDSIADAFSPSSLSGHNAGLIRPGAYLSIVLVNGVDTDDANDAIKGFPYPTSLSQAVSLVRSLKPDSSMVSVSYINAGADAFAAAPSIGKLVQLTGGIEVNTNQAAGASAFLNLFASTAGVGVFHLTTPGIYTGPFQVAVDGVPSQNWSYDRIDNDITFQPGYLPVPGSTVTVTYPFGCP